jgi:hypothetical protein
MKYLTDKPAWGLYKNGIIYLEGDAKGHVHENAYRHEVFHMIFDKFLTNPERTVLLGLAREEFGEMSDRDLEENLAQYAQTFQIPLIRRFLSFTKANMNTLEGLFEHYERTYMTSPYDKEMGNRSSIDIARDFSHPKYHAMDLFRAAEETFINTIQKLTRSTDPNDPVYTLNEAIEAAFPRLAKNLDILSNKLTNATIPEEREDIQNDMIVISMILKNKENMLTLVFKDWDQSKVKAKTKIDKAATRLSRISLTLELRKKTKKKRKLSSTR